MKILMKQFLLRNHSWSEVGRSIAQALIDLGHDVHLFGTDGDNGTKHLPEKLKPYLIGYTELNKQEVIGREPDKEYDCQISYTAMRNFKKYLSYGNKNRFGIWNYETTVLPSGFAKYYKDTDLMLPSSQFSKDIFVKNKIPEDKMVVVPHGVDIEKFKNAKPYPLKTKKKYKILANIAQPHLRKNIPGLLTSYGRAFISKDDVCLILKISNNENPAGNEISFQDQIKIFKNTFKDNAPDIEIISGFIDNIEDVYKTCHVSFTMSHAECWHLPSTEMLASGGLVIAPKHGGQLQFLHDNNSLLIPGKEVAADLRMQYWTQSPYAAVFQPDIDAAAEILQNAIKNYDSLMEKFRPVINKELPNYTWSKIAKQIEGLCV